MFITYLELIASLIRKTTKPVKASAEFIELRHAVPSVFLPVPTSVRLTGHVQSELRARPGFNRCPVWREPPSGPTSRTFRS